VDASAIAARLGGGGHSRAAGCTIELESLEEAEAVLLKSVREELEAIKT
jgi:phosphoesterase RecJ-like protein